LACCSAALAGILVAQAHERAETARDGWGTTTAVLVTTGPVAAGEPLRGQVHEVRWPRALAPEEPVHPLPDGARAAADLGAGMPLDGTSLRRTPRPPTGSTVAIPLGEVAISVEVGDRVDLWASADPLAVADGDAATVRVARGARVVAVDGPALSVAVEPAEVRSVVDAAASATITVVRGG
jgi:hypothetical protein